MNLRVTITDIANELNTTPATVSRALNNHPSISPARKKVVLETAERLKYRHNKIASSLRLGQSGLIGVIIPSAEINFFGSVVHGIETVANQNGYNVLIYQSNESAEHEGKGIETFLSARVDGIMASVAKNTTSYSHFLSAKAAGIPVVFFDRAVDNLGIHSVVVDDFKGAYIATTHLIEQSYKRIGHISGPSHIKIFNDRLSGYKAALQDNRIKLDQQLIYSGNVSIDAGRKGIAQFLKMDNPADAVFAVEDFTALGAIKELKDNNIKIPEDFGVIGFANEGFGEHVTPTLSTVDQQTVQMGKESFRLLMQLMENSGEANTTVVDEKVILEPLPIFRNSSLRSSKSS